MNGIRLCLASLAVLALTLLGLTGCNGDTAGVAAGPATVRLVLANSRAVAPTDIASLVFTQVDLLSATANPTAPSLANWQFTPGLINPNDPIPLMPEPGTIPVMTGQTLDAEQVLTALVPAGSYQTIRLQLDSAFAGLGNQLNLPFSAGALQALIPIAGGMTLDPNESVTLLVDLVQRRASIL
jgi:hypothetical protein